MPRRSALTREILLIGLVVLIGLALRLDFLIASHFVIDADEGIVGLMAHHINQGLPVPIFYYGQPYMGSFEPLLVSWAFTSFGMNSVVLKLVPLLFALATIVLSYWIATTIGGKKSGRIAALFCAVAPSFFVIWSTKARGGFIEIIFLTAVALLSTLYWLREPRLSRTLFIGFVLGFGWWVNNQIIFCIPPIALFMFLRIACGDNDSKLVRIGEHLVLGMCSFVCGGVLYWIYNFQNDFASFGLYGHSNPHDILAHLTGLFDKALPILLGARREWQSEDAVFPVAPIVVWCLYGFLLLSLVIVRAPQLRKLLKGKVDKDSGPELLLVFLASNVVIFSLSSFGYLVQAPRYLLPMYIGIFPLLGLVLTEIQRINRVFSVGILCVILSINCASLYWQGRAIPGEPHVYSGERVSKDHTELILWLRDHDISWVRTNYWIGYRLAFETGEQVRFLLFQEPHQTRIPAYRHIPKRLPDDRLPLILVPAQVPLVREALTLLGMQFREISLSGYVVIYDVTPHENGLNVLDTQSFTLSASRMQDEVTFAIDHDVQTRWRSAQPQSPDLWFRFDFSEPQLIRSMRYDIGSFTPDWPRKLAIHADTETGKVHLLNEFQWRALSYYIAGESFFQIYFQPIQATSLVLTQAGSDPVFDWSIAEIELFQ